MTSTIKELQKKTSLMTVQQFNRRLDLLDQELVLVLEEFLKDTGIGVCSVNMELNDQCEYEVKTGLLFPEATAE